MKRLFAMLLVSALLLSMTACGAEEAAAAPAESITAAVESVEPPEMPEAPEAPEVPEVPSVVEEVVEEPEYVPTEEEAAARTEIENALNLRNNPDQEWIYSASYDAWILSVVTAVVSPELPNQQGVSVAVPGAYVQGIDTDGDGQIDVTSADGEAAVKGSLVLDRTRGITSENGQEYTADTAPVVFTTGAAGYGSQNNSAASAAYTANGYISVSCGNRGKSDSVKDEEGNILYYTGDAPTCLCDQKAAARYVKYNMLLGNLPGNPELFVTTGGSGGAAHASMFAATSNHPDFYDYQIEAGAVGVYRNADGSYTSAVTIDGESVPLSDGAWGSVAYSTVSSLAEADMAQAFEYYIDTTYEFNTPFQAQLAEYLAESYMNYINGQELIANEALLGFDVDGNGSMEDLVALTIEYDPDAHPDTNGYYGTYLNLYCQKFVANLQWYLDNLSYAEGWTWFDESGAPMADDAVAAMTAEDKALCFIEGRYTKGSSGGMGMGGPGGMGGPPDGGPMGDPPGDLPPDLLFGEGIRDGGPMAGSTASSGGGADSSNYAAFGDMVAEYKKDVESIEAGDAYGKNLVQLYDPTHYIGLEGTEDPAWAKIIIGAVEGDIPTMCSMNLEMKWQEAGTATEIHWQWDGGHVPGEVLGESLALTVDTAYGKFMGAKTVEKQPAAPQTANGDATEASGKDLSGWVSYTDGKADFSLADAMIYRNSGASKAVPGFDVIDYGQEDPVFGNREQDSRHWNRYLLDIFLNEEYAKVLEPLFNQ